MTDKKITMRYAPRTSVQLFAERMEVRLRANDHKGGWETSEPEHLLARLYEEVAELAVELKRRGTPPKQAAMRIAHEAADVANFAMMLADIHGGLGHD